MAYHHQEETPGNETYVFFEPDSKANLAYHEGQKPDPLSFKATKGATLIKIIEKITSKGFSGTAPHFICYINTV